MQVLTLYGTLAYIFQYESAAEYYEANLPIAQHLFDSVRISPPASRAQTLSIIVIGIGSALGGVIGFKARKKESFTSQFLRETKRLFPSAFGIEVLCVASAEIGGFLGLWYYGFNAVGIVMAYVLAYAIAGFTTFASILGRSALANDEEDIICGCSDMTADHDHNNNTSFGAGIKQTFVNFARGLKMIPQLHTKSNARRFIKTSLIILISAESGCIIAGATVDIILYQYSAFLSIPAALLAGTLTVSSMAAYRIVRLQDRHRPAKELT
jgi:putative flippase GtrA